MGENEKTGMSIVSIKLPTGWTAIEESIELLKEMVDLKRFEISNENRIFLYFDQVFDLSTLKKLVSSYNFLNFKQRFPSKKG